MDEVEISGNVLVVAKRKVRVNSLALTKGAQLQCQDVCEFKTFARVDKDSTLLIEGGVVRSSEGTFRPSPGATGASRIPLRTLSIEGETIFYSFFIDVAYICIYGCVSASFSASVSKSASVPVSLSESVSELVSNVTSYKVASAQVSLGFNISLGTLGQDCGMAIPNTA